MSAEKKPAPIDLSDYDIVHLNASKNYISEAEFLKKDGTYRELEVEIESMTREPPDDPTSGKELLDIIKLKGKEKRFITNKTNRGRIAAKHGRKPRDWYGKTVVLMFDTSKKYRNPKTGEMGNGAIRVKVGR